MSNKCPHCGSEKVAAVKDWGKTGHGECDTCMAKGPNMDTPREAIDSFCRPRHLVAEYDAKIAQRDAQIERLRTSYQNGGGALLDEAFAATERWLEDQ